MKRQPTGQISMSEISSELYGDIKRAYREDVPDVYIPDITIKGRTLVNLLGRRGNPVYNVVPPAGFYYAGTPAIEDNTFTFTITQDTNLGATQNCGYSVNITSGKYYICLSDIICGKNTENAIFAAWQPEYVSNSKPGYVTNKTLFETSYLAFYAIKTGTVMTSNVFNGTLIGDVNKFKNCRVYEISKEEYDLINSTLEYSGSNVGKLYPYVDDIRPVVNPYIECKENLLDGIQYIIGSFKEDGAISPSSEAEFAINNINIPVKPNTVYTLSQEGIPEGWTAYGQFAGWFNVGGTFHSGNNEFINIWITKNGEATNANAKIALDKLKSGEWKIILTEGSEPKKFDECHNSRIMFETRLYDGENIHRRNDGSYVKNTVWGEVDLSRYEFAMASFSRVGHKYVMSVEPLAQDVEQNSTQFDRLVRYDGEVFYYDGTAQTPNSLLIYRDGASYQKGRIGVCIPNELSGWADSYTPTQEEIKAFFLGWRMFKSDTNGTLYDGTGNKAWAKLWSGAGTATWDICKVVSGSGTLALPKEMNDKAFVPYKVIYKKQDSYCEDVTVHGSLMVSKDTNLTIGSGLVLDEMVEISKRQYPMCLISSSNDNYQSKLVYRPKYILGVSCNDGNNLFTSVTRSTYDIVQGQSYGQAYYISSDYCNADYLICEWDTVTSFGYSISNIENIGDVVKHHSYEITLLNDKVSKQDKHLKNLIENDAPISNPNLLINGDFKIWQRGETLTSTGVKYLADRWWVSRSSYGHTYTASRSSFNNKSALRISESNTETGQLRIGYVVDREDSAALAGKTLTLSGYTNVSHIGSELGLYVYVDTGATTGPVTADIFLASRDLTNRQGYFKLTFTLPVNTTGFKFFFQNRGQTTSELSWFELAEMKLEVGKHATPFIPRPYAEELAMCQRYYQRVFPTEVAVSRTTSKIIKAYTSLNTEMRVNPTVTGTLNIIDMLTDAGAASTSTKFYANTNQIVSEITGTFDINRKYAIMQTYVVADAEIY